MAKAPKPGVGREQEEADEAQKVLTITIKREITTAKGRVVPETHTLAPALIPMRERLICRKATGLPFGSFWSEDRIDVDSLFVMWWMARRAHGEHTLTFDKAADEWPDDLDIAEDLDIEVEGADDDEGDDDPES